jgi:RNA polymerase sigma factor (sigma-70 family)
MPTHSSDRQQLRSPVSAERERRLVTAAQEGDAQARAELVNVFMPLVASVARLYRSTPGVERVELLQEGVVGLLRAVERFDPELGTPFWAYAGWWVRQAMQQLVSELTGPIVLSDRAARHLARIRNARRQALAESGREPSREQLAASAGVPAEHVDHLVAVDRPPRSTEDAVTTEDGAAGTLGDLLADPLAESEYDRVLTAIECENVVPLLAGLSERERMILRARHGFDGEEQSLREIGERLGISGERVRQVEQQALGKLAAAIHANTQPAEAA